jgi:NAD(P)-dependent dehydrogenase (short-subunit alcohol dehydrogenase family)
MFHQEVVIVTGGARGIGKACCKAFAQAGANVVFGDCDTNTALKFEKEWAQRINPKTNEGEITFVQWDATKTEDYQKVVQTALQKYQKIDILINNVAVQPPDSAVPVHLMEESIWDRLHNVNLKSYFLMSKAVLPVMIKQKHGNIINMSSIQGLQSQRVVSAYASTKGAILAFTRALAIDYGKYNIQVNSICPGTINTELGSTNTDFSYAISNTPLGRIGEVSDVTGLAFYLASSRWVTGQNFVVDGGITSKGGWHDIQSKL